MTTVISLIRPRRSYYKTLQNLNQTPSPLRVLRGWTRDDFKASIDPMSVTEHCTVIQQRGAQGFQTTASASFGP